MSGGVGRVFLGFEPSPDRKAIRGLNLVTTSALLILAPKPFERDHRFKHRRGPRGVQSVTLRSSRLLVLQDTCDRLSRRPARDEQAGIVHGRHQENEVTLNRKGRGEMGSLFHGTRVAAAGGHVARLNYYSRLSNGSISAREQALQQKRQYAGHVRLPTLVIPMLCCYLFGMECLH